MIFCEQCGTKIDEGEGFCRECGAQISAGQSSAPAPVVRPVNPPIRQGNAPTPQQRPVNPPVKKEQVTPKAEAVFSTRELKEAAQTAGKVCVECAAKLEQDWLICPYCKAEAGPKTCATCGKELQQTWLACPYCRTETNEQLGIRNEQ